MRKKPMFPAGLFRRLEAGILGLAVLWTAAVTAGSDTAAAAFSALRDSLPLGLDDSVCRFSRGREQIQTAF